ncbi:MAG TPA: hypothetical protein VMB71_07385, partial [Acetobacteraceae bacterium]|nr:hypothetical protein [Acetobacteraceae bacterium]
DWLFDAIDKSLLLLFFRKEVRPLLVSAARLAAAKCPAPGCWWRGRGFSTDGFCVLARRWAGRRWGLQAV